MSHTASQIIDLKVLWRNVCARRGTAAPEARGLEPLLSQLDDAQWRVLEATLQRCMRAGETGQDMEVLSWGAACTRASSAARLEAVGLAWRPATLFAAGMMLMTQGWNMTARLVHLESSPADVAQLAKVMEDVEGRAIALASRTATTDTPGTARPHAAATGQPRDTERLHPSDSGDVARFDILDDATPLGHVPSRPADKQAMPEAITPAKTAWTSLKLYGREAAHTLEVGAHRRGDDFFGAHVVTIESARAMAAGGYDWKHKLSVQLTPEEMPAVVAVLMGLMPGCKFDNHGSDRNKFVELRSQVGGIQLVTGQKAGAFAVPVKTATVYYLLNLFCLAMIHGQEGMTRADVLALVSGIYAP